MYKLYLIVYRLNVSSPNLHVEILSCNWIYEEVGPLGGIEVLRVEPSDVRISALMRRGLGVCPPHVRTP